MILVEKHGYIFSRTNKKPLRNSKNSKLWEKNRVASTSKYLDLIKEESMIPRNS